MAYVVQSWLAFISASLANVYAYTRVKTFLRKGINATAWPDTGDDETPASNVRILAFLTSRASYPRPILGIHWRRVERHRTKTPEVYIVVMAGFAELPGR